MTDAIEVDGHAREHRRVPVENIADHGSKRHAIRLGGNGGQVQPRFDVVTRVIADQEAIEPDRSARRPGR